MAERKQADEPAQHGTEDGRLRVDQEVNALSRAGSGFQTR